MARMATTPTTPRTLATTQTPSGRQQAAEVGLDGLDVLELTIDPIDAERFLAEHWERRPLIVRRAESGRFDGILSAGDVERLVCTTAIRAPAFRLVKEGAQIPLSEYTENVPWRPGGFSQTAVVSRVADEFERGATIVIQALNLHWHPAAVYCRALESRLGSRVQANAYYTPALAQGFSVHHDTHDVFVLQVSGRKRWRLYEPLVELPLKTQRWSQQLGGAGEAVEDLVLEEGDTLYLPRGWPHEAASADADSLHLTIGMHPHTRLDALRAALESCAEDVEFRRSVGSDGALPADLLDRLAGRLEPRQVARRRRRSLVSRGRPILDGQLAQVRALAHLSTEHELERRPTVIAELELSGDGATLLFDGKEVVLPIQARTAVEALHQADGPFTAAELPGSLDEDGRLVLVRRLVREGFLRVLGA